MDAFNLMAGQVLTTYRGEIKPVEGTLHWLERKLSEGGFQRVSLKNELRIFLLAQSCRLHTSKQESEILNPSFSLVFEF